MTSAGGPVPDYGGAAELRVALRRLARATEDVTRRHGLTPRRYELLLFVKAAEMAAAAPTVTSLCDALQTTQGSVTQLVDGAVRAGLLGRAPSVRDRRSHTLQLTPLGEERLRGAFLELGSERDGLAAVVNRRFPERPGPTSPSG
jgi:DNA-binding MarR family transcriptional regulator